MCFAPGVKLDFRPKPDDYVCTAGDMEAELKRIGHKLAPGDIVLVNTRASEIFDQPGLVDAGCGMAVRQRSISRNAA
jgi:hypothetical protein